MLTEQGEIIHGWSEKWNAENRKLQNAAKRVNKFRDIRDDDYRGISVKQTESGETVITIALTPEDIQKAPKTVKRIFSDATKDELLGERRSTYNEYIVPMRFLLKTQEQRFVDLPIVRPHVTRTFTTDSHIA